MSKLESFRADLKGLLDSYGYFLVCSDPYEWVNVIPKCNVRSHYERHNLEDGSSIDYYYPSFL